MATKTYPQLGAQTGVEDADILASYRGLGPLKRVTAGAVKAYAQTDVPGTNTTFQQAGADSIVRTAQAKMRDAWNVLDTDGVDNTGVVECAAALQASIDEAFDAGQAIVAYGTFRIESKVVFKGDADFSQALFNVYAAPEVAVEISTGNAVNPTSVLIAPTIWLPRIYNMTKPSTGWAGQGVGVRAVNVQQGQIFVNWIRGFARNFVATSYGGNGNVHNNYFLGFLENGEINIDLNPGDDTSWVNQNTFFGGRCHQNSGEGTSVAGTRQIRVAKAATVVNGNEFINTSIEGAVAEYHLENGGSENIFFGCRFEASPPKVLYTADNTNQANGNMILRGVGVASIVFTYDGTPGYLNTADSYTGSVSSVGLGHRIQNQSSSAAPIFTFYEAGTPPETAGATEWSTKFGAQTLEYKIKAQTYPRTKLDGSVGRLYFGDGTIAPVAYIGAIGSSSIASFGPWFPGGDNTYAMGDASLRWTNVYGTNIRPGAGAVIWTSGTGTPEGAVTAPVGSLFTRTDGGAATTLYVKESGSGNTGWAAK